MHEPHEMTPRHKARQRRCSSRSWFYDVLLYPEMIILAPIFFPLVDQFPEADLRTTSPSLEDSIRPFSFFCLRLTITSDMAGVTSVVLCSGNVSVLEKKG